MIDVRLKLSTDKCKALFTKYFGTDICDFIAYISKNDDGNALILSSDGIKMEFNSSKMEEIIIDLFNNDVSKIDNVHVYIVNKEDRKYVGVACDMAKECIKFIMDIIG
jgi:hypothetical protein